MNLTPEDALNVRDIIFKSRHLKLVKRIDIVQEQISKSLYVVKNKTLPELLDIAYLIGCFDTLEGDVYTQPLSDS